MSLAAAGLVGLLFAIHPLHVESVAWVSERKDVLCGVFYVLALLFHVRFAEHHKRSQYLASLGAFAMALLSKPMAVSLPLVMLILDAYPLTRLTRTGRARALVEKIPFVMLGVASSLMTLEAQGRGHAVLAMRQLGIAARVWGALRALGFYLAKTVLPIDLSPFYPREYSPWRWDFLLSLALFLVLTTVAVALRRRVPAVAALWAAYLVMLLPVIGIIQVGEQAAADRYMYLPLLVPVVGTAAAAVRFGRSGRATRIALMTSALVAAAGLSILTVRQIAVWRDTSTLWTWVIQKQPRAAIAHYNLGDHLRRNGDLDGARRCWRRAAELEPSFSWPLSGLANLAVLRGDLDEARHYFELATNVNMHDAEAQYNFATFLEERGQLSEALAHYALFVRFAPQKYANLIAEVQAKLAQSGRPQGPDNKWP